MTQSGVFGWLLVYLRAIVDQIRKLDGGNGQVLEGGKDRWKSMVDDKRFYYLEYP